MSNGPLNFNCPKCKCLHESEDNSEFRYPTVWIGLRRADQGGMEGRRVVAIGGTGRRSNLVNADFGSCQRSRRNYRACPSQILIRTPSLWTGAFNLAFLCFNVSSDSNFTNKIKDKERWAELYLRAKVPPLCFPVPCSSPERYRRQSQMSVKRWAEDTIGDICASEWKFPSWVRK